MGKLRCYPYDGGSMFIIQCMYTHHSNFERKNDNNIIIHFFKIILNHNKSLLKSSANTNIYIYLYLYFRQSTNQYCKTWNKLSLRPVEYFRLCKTHPYSTSYIPFHLWHCIWLIFCYISSRGWRSSNLSSFRLA